MRSFITILLGLVLPVGLFAGSLQFTYEFSNPEVRSTRDFQSLVFDNTYLTAKVGEPALPYQAVKLLLPPGEEAISVEYIFEDETTLPGSYVLYPQQPSHPVSLGGDGIFHRNNDLYRSSQPYPTKAFGEFFTHFLNGHSFLMATFTPVKYIPATGSVSYYSLVTVIVKTRPTERASIALQNLRNSERIGQRIGAMAQNREMPDVYRSVSVLHPQGDSEIRNPKSEIRDQDYQILIVTPQQFSTAFDPLKSIYIKRGMKTEIVTTEFISANMAGQDLQQKVRNYIIQEYQQKGIEFVLLGGDVEHVPARGFYCYVQSGWGYEDNNIPSDLYYSALDGTWNDNGNNLWGEIGEDDLLPDVAVARFPVSNLSQLNNMINKTVLYQDQPVLGELRHPIMAGEHLWDDPLTYGEDYLELLIGLREDNGYTTNGIPDDHTFNKLYDHISSWSGNNLIQAINQGSSFIHHSGHANQTYVMRLNISQITSATFSPVNGSTHNFTLVYTHGCLCGAFDENDCIGEAMVCIDNFAVAGAFNSRYGWFNEGQTEGPSAHLHREFVDALYNDREQRIGAAHMRSRIETSPWVNAPGQWEEGALRWCFYACNIFGDPALGVWTDEPISITTVYPEEVEVVTTSIPVTVTSDGQPVEGLSTVVLTDGMLAGNAVTDAFGQAVILVPGGFEGVSIAELVVSGYNCLPQHYPLSIQVGTDENTAEPYSLAIRPNPFNNQFSLSFDLDQPGKVEISLISLSGQVLRGFEHEGNTGRNEIMVRSDGLPEGMMTIRLRTGKKVMHQQVVHLSK